MQSYESGLTSLHWLETRNYAAGDDIGMLKL